jgi:hypothetical protein
VSIRDVRPTDDFYRDLDQALTLAGGVMTRSEFGLYVLPEILRGFATDWDQLPMPIPGRTDYGPSSATPGTSAPTPWKPSWPGTTSSN